MYHRSKHNIYFYPRPPGGGRLNNVSQIKAQYIFLSTPSGWRATTPCHACFQFPVFLSTPSGWRATDPGRFPRHDRGISIHALRVEGDLRNVIAFRPKLHFYPRPPGGGRLSRYRMQANTDASFLSTPSGWRATYTGRNGGDAYFSISIHALRVEGDSTGKYQNNKIGYFYPRPPGGGRQRAPGHLRSFARHFYPRPPGGGRPQSDIETLFKNYFYPRPPGGGRPLIDFATRFCLKISIHALRVEGDHLRRDPVPRIAIFLSTPSGWRATAGSTP